MPDVSKRFEQVVVATHKKFIDEGRLYPVKTGSGILVGDVLIKSDGYYKSLWQHDICLYDNISLNSTAIKMANYIALKKPSPEVNKIYSADQEYNRWYVDSTLILASYNKCLENRDYFKADVLWARYIQAKEHAKDSKKKAQRISSF